MSDASNSPRPAAPGLDAVNAACRAIYPDQPNPLQVTAVVKHWWEKCTLLELASSLSTTLSGHLLMFTLQARRTWPSGLYQHVLPPWERRCTSPLALCHSRSIRLAWGWQSARVRNTKLIYFCIITDDVVHASAACLAQGFPVVLVLSSPFVWNRSQASHLLPPGQQSWCRAWHDMSSTVRMRSVQVTTYPGTLH